MSRNSRTRFFLLSCSTWNTLQDYGLCRRGLVGKDGPHRKPHGLRTRPVRAGDWVGGVTQLDRGGELSDCRRSASLDDLWRFVPIHPNQANTESSLKHKQPLHWVT